MTWITRLRAHADGRLLETAKHGTPEAAMAAYRTLLAREDLIGQPMAAVFKPPAGAIAGGGNISTFFSRFDCEIGRGRIAPDDPRLDPWATQDAAMQIAGSLPPATSRPPAHDWEADERPLADCLREWQRSRGSREGAAAALRVPLTTYHGWMAGRGASQEGLIRLTMTLLDRQP